MADDPFAGLKLSNQTSPSPPPAKLDQRLFSTELTPPPAPPPEPQDSPENAPSTPEPPIPAPKPKAPERAALKPPSLTRSTFDLEEEALYKSSFVFTQGEQEALEDLKLELSREHGDKVFKNDLIRAALHLLIEDYRTNGTKSYAAKKTRRR